MNGSRSRAALAFVLSGALAALAGCGQKGPLYLPDEASEIVTRPTQTPPSAPGPAGSNTPQTPDTPVQPASPAPEVTGPPSDKEQESKPGSKPPP